MLILPIAKVLKRAATVDRTELLDYLQQQQRRAYESSQFAKDAGAVKMAEYKAGQSDALIDVMQHLLETEMN